MDNKICKKCKKPLPNGYKHKKCESCRNKSIEEIKNVGKVGLSVVAFVGMTVVAVVTKGKIDLDNK